MKLKSKYAGTVVITKIDEACLSYRLVDPNLWSTWSG